VVRNASNPGWSIENCLIPVRRYSSSGVQNRTLRPVRRWPPGAADPQRLAHRAAVAVRRDQVGGAQGVFVPVAPAQPRRDAICVLLEADQLGLEPDVGAELDRPFAKYRLEPVLGERGAPARRVLDLEDLRLLGRPGGLLEPLPGEALDADPARPPGAGRNLRDAPTQPDRAEELYRPRREADRPRVRRAAGVPLDEHGRPAPPSHEDGGGQAD
jgi:hypothetical protein